MCDGWFYIDGSSSNLPIQYDMFGISGSNYVDSLCAGTYIVTLIDASGCVLDTAVIVEIPIYGCIDSLAFNYDDSANVDDGSCIPIVSGCTDYLSLNFDSLANTDDGSCIAIVYGCTDPLALNFDLLANIDDSTCCGNFLLPNLGTQLGQDIDGESTYDHSGHAVSVSDDGFTVAIGAFSNDGNGANSGHVRIYNFNGTSWNQLGQDIDGEASDDYSGHSVSLSSDGSTVAIGARFNAGNGYDQGNVRVYNFNGTSWDQLGQDIDGEASDDHSGWSVSLSSCLLYTSPSPRD